MKANEGLRPPLEGIRVIDRTDEYGAYAGRLLAGLGAEVIRVIDGVEEQPGDKAHHSQSVTRQGMFDEFVNAGKKSVTLETAPRGERALEKLVESADIVLSSSSGRAPGDWLGVNPKVVHVVMTPFGWGLSPEFGPVDDLIVLGSGGLLHLGGYPDIGPVGAYGNQSQIACGIFGAVAALVGLIERHHTGKGNYADVSAQEAIAQALEDHLPTYVLTGEVKGPHGERAREAGTGLYACADGYVSMVAGRLGTARAWASLVDWLTGEYNDGAELAEAAWSDFAFRQTDHASARFRELFEGFAADRTKNELYQEAQRRGIALSPVSDVGDLLENEQLASRGFFHRFHHRRLDCDVSLPGPPFQFSNNSLPALEEAPDEGEDTRAILRELGLTDAATKTT